MPPVPAPASYPGTERAAMPRVRACAYTQGGKFAGFDARFVDGFVDWLDVDLASFR
jgi:hypothetical protein